MAPMTPMNQCPNGHPLDPGVRFCRLCGASVPEGSVTGGGAGAPGGHRPTDSNRVVYAIAGAVIVLGVVAIAVALVLGSGNGSQKPSQASVSGGATPTSGSTSSTGATTGAPSTAASSSAAVDGAPAGGTRCSGTANGAAFGTIGSMTSCDFAGAVYQAYSAAGNAQGPTLTATSPVTHKTYTNIVCSASGQWVTCVGGQNNSARVFFAVQ